MKRIKLILALIFITGITVPEIQAQSNYQTGIGVRLGGWAGSGLSFKHFTSHDVAIEAMLTSYYYNGLTLTALYEKHQVAFQQDGLNFFYGVGAHVGGYSRGYYRYYYYDNRYYNNGFVVVGIDAIIGLEYKIPTIPFTVGADLHPLIEFVNYPGWGALDGALTLRYAF